MKKFTSRILSLVLALCTVFTAAPMIFPVEAAVADAGYEFTDMAYSPSLGMYVALAKDIDGADQPAKLYASADGTKWTDSVLSISNAKNYGNPNSCQNLVWWEGGKKFVAGLGSQIYCSYDGLTWEENKTMTQYTNNAGKVENITNIIVETNGQQLMIASGKRVRLFDAEKDQFAEHILSSSAGDFYGDVIGIKPAAEDGSIQCYLTYGSVQWPSPTADLTAVPTEDGYSFSEKFTWPKFECENMFDLQYDAKNNNWLMVMGTNNLFVINGAASSKKIAFTVEETANVTAAGINDEFVFIGTSTGKIYFTENKDGGITAESAWTEVPADGEAVTGEIRNITASKSGSFIVLANDKAYTANKNGYTVNVYKGFEQPTVARKNPFEGVRLIGGAYSPEHDVYIVYGNAPDGGRIFTSMDHGASWELTHSHAILFSNVPNGAVWWPERDMFVVSSSTSAQYGTCWYSTDAGKKWNFMNLGIGLTTDIAVNGGTLYTTNNSRRIRRFTELSAAAMDESEVIPMPESLTSYYCMRMASGDETIPSILVADTNTVSVKNGATVGDDGKTGTWTAMKTGEYGTILDVAYSSTIGKFIVTQKDNGFTKLITKDGAIQNGPSAANVLFNAVLANDSTVLFGGNNGQLYAAAATPDLSDVSALNTVSIADGQTKNNLPATSIFSGANGQFIVTVSDGVVEDGKEIEGAKSDVLFVDANANEYRKASEELKVDSLTAGETIVVKVQSTNNTNTDVPFTMITGIYDGGKLIQVVSEEKVMTAGANEYLTQEITLNEDVPETAKMKVYLWNSLEGMQPVAESTGFFQ